jgi:hypothetical protein
MSRVVTHAVKQASLNLKDMIDKKNIGVEISDITDIVGSEIKTWKNDDVKPEVLTTTIEQIRGLFNVGTEVKEWTVTYYPAPVHSTEKKGTYLPSETRIPSGGKNLAARFIVIVGSRDIANLALAVGSTEAENSYLVMAGDCLNVKIAVCPVLDVYFNNINNEKLAARKGFRETIIKKNIANRHILVFDAHVEMSAVVGKIKDELLSKSSTLRGLDI